MKICIALAWLVYVLCNDSVYGDDEPRLQLRIHKHQPCTKGSPSELIRFSDNNEAPLVDDPKRGQGCYLINGTVRVLKDLTGTMQIYVETKYGTKAPVEKCQGADDNGCGGTGSCVYCDACEGIKDLSKSAVQLVVGNKPLDCKKGLTAKNYTDIQISFCMLKRKEFLKSQHLDEDFWNRYGASGQMVFLTMFVFNKPVNTMPRDELVKIATPESEEVCGCQKLVGSIYDPSAPSSR